MSIVKLAMAASGAVTPLLASFSVAAANSGNPFKFLAQKSSKASIMKVRQKMQRSSIATVSNTINNIRAGKVQDSTRLVPSIVDSLLGHANKVSIGALESKYKNSSLSRKIINSVVDTSGRIDVPKLERAILLGNKVHASATHLAKKKLALNGATIGFGAGATRGAIKEFSNKDLDNRHVVKSSLKSGLKGAVIGATIGGSVKAAANKIKNAPTLKQINKVKNIYFADDYWRNNIIAANENPVYRKIGKIGADMFTADPVKRGVRMARFEAMHDFFNQDVRDVFKKENRHKAKRALETFKDSFRQPSTLERKFKINQPKSNIKSTKFRDILKIPTKKFDNADDIIYEYK